MSTMHDVRLDFIEGRLGKADYIDKMYDDFHSSLFAYANWLSGTNIKTIEVSDSQVVMVSRDRGVKFVCPEFDKRVAPVEILNFDQYELSDFNMVMSLIEPGSSVLDIGANMGWYALNIAKSQPKTVVYAFEPLATTFDFLRKNVEINGLANVFIHNFGFSSEKRDLEFYFYPEGSGNASSANLSDRDDVQKVTCHVEVLDEISMSLNLKKVDFIKCDVEGAELLVFQGALKLLRRDKPMVFTEMLRKWAAKFNYHPNDIIDLFSELGYQCFTSTVDGRLKSFSEMDEETVETNFFFLHPESHAAAISKFLA